MPRKPLITTKRPTEVRTVICTHCGGVSEASVRAMSIACPHCHKRVILENYKIRSYHAVIEFSTCGDIVVERKGIVVAPIKVANLTVKGKVQGPVTARGHVTISKTGQLKGDVEAPAIFIEDGGSLNGFLRIGPAESIARQGE